MVGLAAAMASRVVPWSDAILDSVSPVFTVYVLPGHFEGGPGDGEGVGADVGADVGVGVGVGETAKRKQPYCCWVDVQ